MQVPAAMQALNRNPTNAPAGSKFEEMFQCFIRTGEDCETLDDRCFNGNVLFYEDPVSRSWPSLFSRVAWP